MKNKQFVMHSNYCPLFLSFVLFIALNSCDNAINRHSLVTRHNISNSTIDPLNSLTVGNGEFAFTAGITRLQTFPKHYEAGIPLGTMTQWGWHSFPNPENYNLKDVVKYYQAGEDSVPYFYQFSAEDDERKNNATRWLRENPHRLHLGLIGLEILKADSAPVKIEDIQNPLQQLNLWTGELRSQFKIEGVPVEVLTLCHQKMDMLALKIKSPLVAEGRIRIKLNFPYGAHEKFSPGYDFSHAEMHSSRITDTSQFSAGIERILDETTYYTRLQWDSDMDFLQKGNHEFLLIGSEQDSEFEFRVHFSPEALTGFLPDFEETRANNSQTWEEFWTSGGAVDFSECTDPRAYELERRVILSQYLTKIQCSGSLPPQETGLTFNSWHGKFHLEMHWWHALHFILWNRTGLVEEQMKYYNTIYNQAEKTADFQGYKGVRWPKMTDPSGKESPSSIGVFLIWQQPHIIYYADLLYQQSGQDPALLEKYGKLVFATANFMASYARFDSARMEYVLGPALIPAQERFKPEETLNPAFELAYWQWGLETAQKWRAFKGLTPDSLWQQVIDNLAELPVHDGLYLFTEDALDSWSNPHLLTDHPMVLGSLGMLPKTGKVNPEIMRNTLEAVMDNWDRKSFWGWDFPMAAMNAVSLGLPDRAVDLLMMDSPKNTYLLNGHNYQNETLTLYLPGNGGLLTAVAMMCTSRDSLGNNGFPAEGNWELRYENLQKLY